MRWCRVAQFTAAGVLLLWGALLLPSVGHGWFGLHPAWDFDHYTAAARLWLDGGNPYAGPALTGYVRPGPETMPFLHPPLALPLFAAFSFLPWWAWWAVPLGIVGWCLASWRPSGWWAVAALACAVTPRTPEMLLIGNSDLWVAAGLAAGLRFGWPAALVLLKPSMGPLALVGIRRRSWWIAAGLMAAAAVPFGALWLDWWTVVRNTALPLTYSLEGLPLPLVVLFAYLARSADPHDVRALDRSRDVRRVDDGDVDRLHRHPDHGIVGHHADVDRLLGDAHDGIVGDEPDVDRLLSDAAGHQAISL